MDFTILMSEITLYEENKDKIRLYSASYIYRVVKKVLTYLKDLFIPKRFLKERQLKDFLTI